MDILLIVLKRATWLCTDVPYILQRISLKVVLYKLGLNMNQYFQLKKAHNFVQFMWIWFIQANVYNRYLYLAENSQLIQIYGGCSSDFDTIWLKVGRWFLGHFWSEQCFLGSTLGCHISKKNWQNLNQHLKLSLYKIHATFGSVE